MFQRITLLSFVCIALMIFTWAYLFVRVRPCDLALCQQTQQLEKGPSSQKLFTTSHQERKGVIKEIHFVQEDKTRLHYRIQSQTSLLTMQPQGHKIEFIEKLEKIKCWMQDKLYYTSPGVGPMQQIRFLEAEDGLYYYTSQQFLAQSVALSLYRLNNHELPASLGRTTPFLKGIARDVSFAVSGKLPQFKAQHFKAELNHTLPEKP